MNEQTIGTCSICGGAVTVPLIWWGTVAPIPTCSGCGAKKRGHGPVIDMEPSETSNRLARYQHALAGSGR